MITVKLYGLLRLETGIRELQVDAADWKDLNRKLEQAGLKKEDLKGCYVMHNGAAKTRTSKLKDGDVVQLLPPVAGG